MFKGEQMCITFWLEKPSGKRKFWRSRHRWENNIKMDLREMGCENMNWTDGEL
jgi:hypothetical protein